ncbi:MAG: hypothetical protein IBJ13_00455 [Sphingopyxis sp.]|nr:hypothetical protein [Sphingopyxis sp.]
MRQSFMGKGPGFAAKDRGYGPGPPDAGGAWFFIGLHVLMIAGVATVLQGRPMLITIAVILAGLAPMPIYRAKTEGGWRWR